MPRIARIIAPGYPHHVTQRGNNRAQVFFDDEDRQTYLRLLADYAPKYSLQIWAWCLMDNHVHLLVVPESETSLARGIGLTNMVYTQYLNRKLNQSGRIWQNRRKLGTLPIFIDFHSILPYHLHMPRIARIIAPGFPHHVTQRGNNRAQVFFDDEDRQTYLRLLADYASKYSLQIWAWCLMGKTRDTSHIY